MRSIINTLIAIVLLGGTVFLQIFLSKRESKWPGLILPAIFFMISLLYPLNMILPAEGITVGFVFQVIAVFLLANIPTVILLGIYFSCREKQRRKKQLEKMNIQDLQ